MKRTITLTAEDLAFIEHLEASEVNTIFQFLRTRLAGSHLQPHPVFSVSWKKLDSLTRPVKAPSLGVPPQSHPEIFEHGPKGFRSDE